MKPTISPPSRRGLKRDEAAGYIGVSATLFDQLVADGRMPGPKRVGSRSIWDVRALDLAFDLLGEEQRDANPWDD